MAQAYQIQPDNQPLTPPVMVAASKAQLSLATPVGSNHTLLSAMSVTLHPHGSTLITVGK